MALDYDVVVFDVQYGRLVVGLLPGVLRCRMELTVDLVVSRLGAFRARWRLMMTNK